MFCSNIGTSTSTRIEKRRIKKNNEINSRIINGIIIYDDVSYEIDYHQPKSKFLNIFLFIQFFNLSLYIHLFSVHRKEKIIIRIIECVPSFYTGRKIKCFQCLPIQSLFFFFFSTLNSRFILVWNGVNNIAVVDSHFKNLLPKIMDFILCQQCFNGQKLHTLTKIKPERYPIMYSIKCNNKYFTDIHFILIDFYVFVYCYVIEFCDVFIVNYVPSYTALYTQNIYHLLYHLVL